MLRLLSNIVGPYPMTRSTSATSPAASSPDDPGEIVRHARPLDEHARRQLLEQHIARLLCQTSPQARGASPIGRALAQRS